MTNLDETTQGVSRRMMIRGVTVGGMALPLLAACGGGDSDSAGSGSSGAEESSGGDSGDSGGSGGGTTVAKADVPVGSGVILKDAKVVVTQPTDGEFKAFTAVCTHQGCLVAKLVDKKIHCNCHGSEFSIEDGKNVTGPNGTEAGSVAALASKKVTVEGDQISVS
jgi:nitrite reductase/ring-hydroxylating ferredoxin subunit